MLCVNVGIYLRLHFCFRWHGAALRFESVLFARFYLPCGLAACVDLEQGEGEGARHAKRIVHI